MVFQIQQKEEEISVRNNPSPADIKTQFHIRPYITYNFLK